MSALDETISNLNSTTTSSTLNDNNGNSESSTALRIIESSLSNSIPEQNELSNKTQNETSSQSSTNYFLLNNNKFKKNDIFSLPLQQQENIDQQQQQQQQSAPNSSFIGGLNRNNSIQSISNECNNLIFRNPNSIESFTAPSPAGSLIEQFDVTTTPLSVDDTTSDTSINIDSSNFNQTNNTTNNCFSLQPQLSVSSNSSSKSLFDSTSSNFRFRRHSSQSSINLPLNLQINNNNLTNNNNNNSNLASPLVLSSGSYSSLNNNNNTTISNNISNNNTMINGSSNSINSNNSNFTNTERVCSSPINSLKMSSRVCQIKIDEGIEPHLSREIKSERETQNTLKLKSSCDELMINSDDLGLDSFSFDRNLDQNRNNNNSPSFLNNSTNNGSSSTFRRYRTFSESLNQTINNINKLEGGNGNMPSPSISSCQSYSNSSSPTSFLLSASNNSTIPSNSGLLRCYSPSTTLTNPCLNQSQLNQNYFSQSPSPTRKLFVTRRSMSPIPCNIRPSTLNTSNLNTNNNSNKRKISDVEQCDITSSLASSCHSPKRSFVETQQEFVQPLLIFTGNNNNNNNNTINSSLNINNSQINNNNITRVINRSATSSPSPSPLSSITNPSSPGSSQSSLIITAQNPKTDSNIIHKPVTSLVPINVAALKTKLKTDEDTTNKYTFVPIQLPPPSSSPGPLINNQPIQNKKLILLTNNSSQPQLTTQLSGNSPNSYSCDSPISCSPSVSNISSSINGDKPDSGYQSSAQNNSDSESCT